MNRRQFMGASLLVPVELTLASKLRAASRIIAPFDDVGVGSAARQTVTSSGVASGPFFTEPVDPQPDEPCIVSSPIIDGNSPNAGLNQGYHWPPASAFADSKVSFDANWGRLSGLFRQLAATREPHYILVQAVRASLGIPVLIRVGAVPQVPVPVPKEMATALAQLAVTGRQAYANFRQWHPQDSDLVNAVQQSLPGSTVTPAMQDAARQILDVAYTTVWAIRGNDAGWRATRAGMGWIGTSGEDDLPDRPVNVPSASRPQYDLLVHVVGKLGPLSVWTRYMIASDGNDIAPGPRTKPQTPAPGTLRTTPNEIPFIPPQDKLLVYIHGGGSRLEEAEPLARQLIAAGKAAGMSFTVIAFDMPNTGYSAPFDHLSVAVKDDSYHPDGNTNLTPVSTGTSHLEGYPIMGFEERFVTGFVDALDQQYGNIKNRIAAVMGGSLGGNMSLQLARHSGIPGNEYLRTIVAWSSTCFASNGDIGAWLAGHSIGSGPGSVGGGLVGKYSAPEQDSSRGEFFHDLYDEPLGTIGPITIIGPQPPMWWRDGWEPCKTLGIVGSRFDRYEYYTPEFRRWTNRLNYEMAIFSFQEGDVYLPNHAEAEPRYYTFQSRLLLAAGEKDDYSHVNNYSNARTVASHMVAVPEGSTTLFLKNTGHSIHDERPAFFATQIVAFLNVPAPALAMRVTVTVTGRTATSKTILVSAADASNGRPLDDAQVEIYGVKGLPGKAITYSTTPPESCWDTVGGGAGDLGPNGKPTQAGKPRKVNVCRGTVTHKGYATATFAP